VGVGNKLFPIEPPVHAEELIILPIKFDPDVVGAWKQLLSIQSRLGCLGLLTSLHVHVCVARHEVDVVELHIRWRLLDHHRHHLSIVREDVHQVFVREAVWQLLDVQIGEGWARGKIPLGSILSTRSLLSKLLVLLVVDTDLKSIAGIHLHEPLVPGIDQDLGSLRTIAIDEGELCLKSSLLDQAPQDEELVDGDPRFAALLLLPLGNLLAVRFIVMKNLVDFLDDVNLCAILV
jgi:hypothetical protein